MWSFLGLSWTSITSTTLPLLFLLLSLVQPAMSSLDSPPNPFIIQSTNDSTSTSPSSSSLEGWFTRSRPLSESSFAESGASFVPTRESLQLILLRNSRVEPEGFSLALFLPDIAVDAFGAARVLERADLEGLVALSREVLTIPETFQWRIDHHRTGYPIENLYIPQGQATQNQVKKVSVYGFTGTDTKLEKTTEGLENIPESLQKLLALALEARSGYVPRESAVNDDLVGQVKALLGEGIF